MSSYQKSTTASRRAARQQADYHNMVHVSVWYRPCTTPFGQLMASMGAPVYVQGAAPVTIDNGGNDERFMRDLLGLRSRQQFRKELDQAAY